MLFGGLQLVGKMIATAPNAGIFSVVTGLVVMMLPLFMLPFIAAKAEGFLGQMNAKLTGAKNKLGGAVQGWADGRSGHAKARYDAAAIRTNKRGKPVMADRLRSIRRGVMRRGQERKLQTSAYQAEQNAAFNKHVMDNEEQIAQGQGSVGTAFINDAADRWRDDEIVRQQKTMTSMNAAQLRQIYMSEHESDERRAAASGMVMKNGAMGDIHQLYDDTQSMADGDKAAIGMRKQMMHDMNRTPFGLGSGDIAALKRGEAAKDESGRSSTYAERLDSRAQGKLSDAAWASLDPDDQQALVRLATGGGLSHESLQNLVNVTVEAEANPNVAVKAEARQFGEQIRRAAAEQGVTSTATEVAPQTPKLGPVGSEVINRASEGTLDVHPHNDP